MYYLTLQHVCMYVCIYIPNIIFTKTGLEKITYCTFYLINYDESLAMLSIQGNPLLGRLFILVRRGWVMLGFLQLIEIQFWPFTSYKSVITPFMAQ
jgi:hypothetical protein